MLDGTPATTDASVAALVAEIEDIYFDCGGQWSAARPGILAHLKAQRAEALEACAQELAVSGSGVSAAKRIAEYQDRIITALFQFAGEHLFPTANRSTGEKVAIVATGGYGRGLLAPGSDIDLLFLYPYRPTPWTESMVETILYMLWDMRLVVGHAARSVDECMSLSRSDLTIRTALLECRFITGEESLFTLLRDRYQQAVVRGTGKKFIAAKLKERDDRHKRQGRTRYLVEPNIKEGKGGLRDLNTLFWIAKYFYRVSDEAELVDLKVFSAAEFKLFLRCEDFLWTVRCHLHLLTKRPEERLTFELQREIAQRLGYSTDRPGMSEVERFMKHYFLVAKDVGDLTRILCAALEAQHVLPAIGFTRIMSSLTGSSGRPLTADFRVENGRIALSRQDAFQTDPTNFIRIFVIANEHNMRPHPDVLAAMRRSIRLIDQTVRDDPEANRLFLTVLTEANDREKLLRLMNETGVLGRFIPDFGKVVAMMQFNMYHHYTVDEHLIRSVGILADIEAGERERAHPLSSQLIGTIKHRRALYVAVFLHDIAKGRPEDHSIEGARIARELCPRLGLSPQETELVVWLIEEHLTMSITAQSRDLSDPKTIDLFAKKAQSFERLKLLEILTEADIAAVGSHVWNGWKAQLLQTLYDETEAIIASNHTRLPRSARVESARRAFVERATSLPVATREAYISRHPAPYWIRTSVDDAHYHATLMTSGDPASVLWGVRARADQAVTEMTLVAPDVPNLLAITAGACASVQANVVSADIFNTRDGVALDVFTFTPLSDDLEREKNRVARIAEMVRQGLVDESVVPAAVDQRPHAVKRNAFAHTTDILIANDWSNRYTAIELSGLDRPGLFRDLANALRDLDLNVRSAQLATFGERVVDVFYVMDAEDAQITDPARQDDIRARLTAAFDGEPTLEDRPLTAV
ncbi:MAG: [protein-PII] uridylyltransferase [Pseudomonadota bacterium]